MAGKDAKNVNIATKFAAFPWRLTPSQIVSACKYVEPILIYVSWTLASYCRQTRNFSWKNASWHKKCLHDPLVVKSE